MHEMRTIVTDVRGVSVSLSISLSVMNARNDPAETRLQCAGSFRAACAKLLWPPVVTGDGHTSLSSSNAEQKSSDGTSQTTVRKVQMPSKKPTDIAAKPGFFAGNGGHSDPGRLVSGGARFQQPDTAGPSDRAGPSDGGQPLPVRRGFGGRLFPDKQSDTQLDDGKEEPPTSGPSRRGVIS